MICLTSKQASGLVTYWGKLLCVQASRLFQTNDIFMTYLLDLRLTFLANEDQLQKILLWFVPISKRYSSK